MCNSFQTLARLYGVPFGQVYVHVLSLKTQQLQALQKIEGDNQRPLAKEDLRDFPITWISKPGLHIGRRAADDPSRQHIVMVVKIRCICSAAYFLQVILNSRNVVIGKKCLRSVASISKPHCKL